MRLCPRASGLSHCNAGWGSVYGWQRYANTDRSVYRDTYANANTNSNSDANTNSHTHADTDAYTDTYSDTLAYRHGHSDANPNRYGVRRAEHRRRLCAGGRRDDRR